MKQLGMLLVGILYGIVLIAVLAAGGFLLFFLFVQGASIVLSLGAWALVLGCIAVVNFILGVVFIWPFVVGRKLWEKRREVSAGAAVVLTIFVVIFILLSGTKKVISGVVHVFESAPALGPLLLTGIVVLIAFWPWWTGGVK